jgi:aryl-alcohol dehydrogenase-like predicted oxidoreductase
MKLALGTAQFGMNYGISNKNQPIAEEEAANILLLCKKFSLDTIDTASSYGDSEKILGACCLKDFKVNTKLKLLPESCKNTFLWVEQEIKKSLDNLKVDVLHAVYIHHPSDLIGPNGKDLYAALSSLKKEGLFLNLGVSIYSPDELSYLLESYNFDIIQAPFNLIDRRLLQSGWLNKLSDMNITVHSRSAFLQGLLLTPYAELEAKFLQWNLFAEWRDWLDDKNTNALEVALAYPLSIKEIDRVIIGVDSLNQLKEIFNHFDTDQDISFPSIETNDVKLLHPGNWSTL